MSSSVSGLPKIPGMGFGEELLRTNFRKCQTISGNKSGQEKKSGTGGCQQFDTLRLSNTQAASESPKKISLERKVLRFQAYFREGVHESPLEQERIRKCIVHYFLEDDTIAVSEPKQDNSGIPGQGALIKRHQIPRTDGGFFTFESFNIGSQLEFFGKTFYLIDCDSFTRKFLEDVGIYVPDAETYPQDQYTETRRKVASQMVPTRPKQDDLSAGTQTRRTKLTSDEIVSTKQFLANDKKVLRFFCVWDNRPDLYGDVRLFTLHYFLSDDTIEITETNPPNCGRDPFPSFIKRSKVWKNQKERFVNPNASLSFKKESVAYFTDKDLRIGETINIFGRSFLIYDCDTFSQNFLRENYGINDFTPVDISLPGAPKVNVEPPPYNGFGDEQDSLGSWKYLVLKAPKQDVKKYMTHANHQLKFQMKMQASNSGDTSNSVRRFVMTYFLADDTLSIFEPAQRNSGIIGGKFLQRSKVKKVGSDGLATGEYIQPQDLYVGAAVVVNTHHFVLYSTDERSLVYMESHPEEFPKSNISTVVMKVRSMLISNATGLQSAFTEADVDRSGKLDYREFAGIIEKFRLPVSEQEIVTLMRHFDSNSDGGVSWQEFLDVLLPEELTYEANENNLESKPWTEIKAIAEQQEADELDRFKNDMHSSVTRLNYVTDLAFRKFMDLFEQRRVLFLSTFRTVADHSPDGCIGEAEFRRAAQQILKLNLPENTLKAICVKIFSNLKRLSLVEFKRVLEGTSSSIL